tara:strand:- start:1228 stop:1710 length:483 start_codon:yes stop_codon:yes gene_type:complete
MTTSLELQHEVEQFLYKEARLTDAGEYRDWEALWTDDAMYWVPANGDDNDPSTEMSIMHDHRSRIALRVSQYYTGKRWTATPESRLCRVVSNVEVLKVDGDEVHVTCKTVTHESNDRIDAVWPSRNDFTLRRVDGEFKLVTKKVVLINNDKPMDTISFLI